MKYIHILLIASGLPSFSLLAAGQAPPPAELVFDADTGTLPYQDAAVFNLWKPVVLPDSVAYLQISQTGALEWWSTNFQPGGFHRIAIYDAGYMNNAYPPEARFAPKAVNNMAIAMRFDTRDRVWQLWHIDGTEAGTGVFQTISGDGFPNGTALSNLWNMNGKVYFVLGFPDHGELWETAGTPQTTTSVVSFQIPGAAANGQVTPLRDVLVGNTVAFFQAGDGSNHTGTWRTGGTSATTVILNGGAEVGSSLRAVGDTLLVMTESNLLKVSPQSTDLESIKFFPGVSGLEFLNHNAPRSFFGLRKSATTPAQEIWSTDGTPGGTVRAYSNPGDEYFYSVAYLNGSYILISAAQSYVVSDPFTSASILESRVSHTGDTGLATPLNGSPKVFVNGSYVYYSGNPAVDGGVETLWRTDGTPQGTIPLNASLPEPTVFDVGSAIGFNGQPYMVGIDNSHHAEWWRIGPNAGDLHLIENVTSQPGASSLPFSLVSTDKGLFFGANLVQMWLTQGTPATTHQVSLPVSLNEASHIRGTAYAGERLIVHMSAPEMIVSTDGTSEGGIVLFDETDLGSSPLNYINLLRVGNLVYFNLPQGNLEGLYRSDGTVEGTFRILPYPYVAFYQENGGIKFYANGALWTTDGAVENTRMLVDLKQYDVKDGITPVFWNAAWWFTADSETARGSLWKTDGTAEGTNKITDLPEETFPIVAAQNGVFLADVNGNLNFSNGTAAGTRLLIRPGIVPVYAVTTLVPVGAGVVFPGNEPVPGGKRQLWFSDGTNEGTYPLTHFPMQANNGERQGFPVLQRIGDDAYFLGNNPGELWRTDGTEAGTGLIYTFESSLWKYLTPGYGFNHVYAHDETMVARDGFLYMTGYTWATGEELFRIPLDLPLINGTEGEGEGEGEAPGGEGEGEGEVHHGGEGEGEGPNEGEGEGEGQNEHQHGRHSCDEDNDGRVSLPEVLRVVQFYNSSTFHCQPGSEDGFAPGPGGHGCTTHASDYAPKDWKLELTEVLRVIQMYNSSGYIACPDGNTEDGYCIVE